MDFGQVGIVVFGVAAIWLSQSPAPATRKFAPVCGLCSQPFWFYSTFVAEQWGIFAISLLYTASWVRGLHNQWFAK